MDEPQNTIRVPSWHAIPMRGWSAAQVAAMMQHQKLPIPHYVRRMLDMQGKSHDDGRKSQQRRR